MKHLEIIEMLPDYLKKNISADDKKMVEDHLSGCPSCHHEMELVRSYFNGINGMERIKAPKDFLFKVNSRIAKSGKKSRWKRWLPLEAFGVVAIAMLVIIVVMPQKSTDVPGLAVPAASVTFSKQGSASSQNKMIKADRSPASSKMEEVMKAQDEFIADRKNAEGAGSKEAEEMSEKMVEKTKKRATSSFSTPMKNESQDYDRAMGRGVLSELASVKDSPVPAASAPEPDKEKMILAEISELKGTILSRTNTTYSVELPSKNLPLLMKRLAKYGSAVKIVVQESKMAEELIRFKMEISLE